MPRYKIEIETEQVFTTKELEELSDDIYFVVSHFTDDPDLVVNAKYD